MRIALVAVLVTGCAAIPTGPTPEQIANAAAQFCQLGTLESYGSCLEQQLNTRQPNWRSVPNGDLLGVYVAWAQAAETKVSAGEITDSDMVLALNTLNARLVQMAHERNYMAAQARAVNQQQALSDMLLGLALIESSQPRAIPTPMPRMPITCRQLANTITCQ